MILSAIFTIGWLRMCMPARLGIPFAQSNCKVESDVSRTQRLRHHSSFLSLRAGCTTSQQTNIANATEGVAQSTSNKEQTHSILVSTTIGSSFLDKKKRLTVAKNCTVLDIKHQISQKFPGSPPIELQRLFLGMRLLSDDDIVCNLTSLNPVPVMLDMMTGTSVYNKTMSVSQAIEAYVSIAVQQSYVGDRLRALFANSCLTNSSLSNASFEIDTTVYREMFAAINSSLHSTYAQDISEALLEEKEPETFSADTAAWRHDLKDKNPITVALAQEFDLNFRGIKNFAYYSVLLAIFAMFGTNSQISSKFLILTIPFLWISKLRQLRLVSKLALNLALPIIPTLEFLMPLLAAPYQVIAIELAKRAKVSENQNGDMHDRPAIVPKSKRQPIVPVPKKNKS